MKTKIQTMYNPDRTLEGVIAKKRFSKKELGILGVKFLEDYEQQVQYAQLEDFRVHEFVRNQGIGKQMIQVIIEELKELKYPYIVVYPSSAPYEGESDIEPTVLYQIYHKLGFSFADKDVDVTRAGEKMILLIQ